MMQHFCSAFDELVASDPDLASQVAAARGWPPAVSDIVGSWWEVEWTPTLLLGLIAALGLQGVMHRWHDGSVVVLFARPGALHDPKELYIIADPVVAPEEAQLAVEWLDERADSELARYVEQPQGGGLRSALARCLGLQDRVVG